MGSKGQQDIKAPKFSQEYEKGLKVYMKFLPEQLQKELEYRMQYDPQFIEQAMGLQHKYDPQLAKEQLDALQRRDPQWLAVHGELGDKIKAALDRGYLDKDQEAAYRRLAGLAGTVDPRYEAAYGGTAVNVAKMLAEAGKVDPRYAAAYGQAGKNLQQIMAEAGKVDPTRAAEYKALGKQVTGDTLRGGTADPETLRQMTQAILSRQPGLSYGEAQNMAAAVYTGSRGQALKQQRQQAGEQFLGQQTTEQQRQQGLAGAGQSASQYLNLIDPTRLRQQSMYNAGQGADQFLSMRDPNSMAQQSLAQFYGLQAPEQNVLGLAGTYIQPSNSITGMLNQIPGVQAPRAFGYVNPNAGYQGVQQGNNLFGMQMAAQGVNQGGGNPWMNALQGAGQGASMGGTFGGGYGAAGGAIVGAAAGAFGYPQYSDERLKNNISRTRLTTPDGIPIVEYDYNGKRWRGVIAQEVEKVRPDAVHHYGNGTLGVFYSRLGIELKEVANAD